MTAPLSEPAREPLVLEGAEIFQVTYEQSGARGHELLPSGLAPTIPTLVTMLVVRVPHGPLGTVSWAQIRLSCRSGARARAYVVGQRIEAHAEAAALLASKWGLGGSPGRVVLHRGYDAVRATCDGLDVTMLDPAPISTHDVQYVTNLVPVATDAGERLAQVELEVEQQRTERGRPVLHSFDGAAWGEPRLRPKYPVAATLAVGTLTLPVLRFLLHPELPPHQGTDVLPH
jgi:hypothetical protein